MVLFTAVQYNDPDALFWGLIYGATALWCGLAAFRPATFSKPLWDRLLTASLILAVIGVAWYWPKTPGWWRQDVWWTTETAREGMGIMIVAFALMIALYTSRRSKTKN